MQAAPMISICIPVYNGEKYLRYTLESVLGQSYRNFEVLIVDDQSTDNSVATIEEYAKRDSRIRTFRNSGRNGLVGNWNECIRNATGIWIKFLFQDDLMSDDCLEKMIRFQQSFAADHKVVFCKRQFIFENADADDESNRKMRERPFNWDIYPEKTCITPVDTARLIIKYSGTNVFGEPSSFLIHKTIFNQFGLFDDSFHHKCDVEYWFRVGLNVPMLFLPEMLVSFRVHSDSTTAFNRREKRMQMRHLDRLRLFAKFLSDPHYRPLREMLAGWPCNMYLMTKTSIYLRRARIEVEEAGLDSWSDAFSGFCNENSNIVDRASEHYVVLAAKYLASRMCIEICWLYSLIKGSAKLRKTT